MKLFLPHILSFFSISAKKNSANGQVEFLRRLEAFLQNWFISLETFCKIQSHKKVSYYKNVFFQRSILFDYTFFRFPTAMDTTAPNLEWGQIWGFPRSWTWQDLTWSGEEWSIYFSLGGNYGITWYSRWSLNSCFEYRSTRLMLLVPDQMGTPKALLCY